MGLPDSRVEKKGRSGACDLVDDVDGAGDLPEVVAQVDLGEVVDVSDLTGHGRAERPYNKGIRALPCSTTVSHDRLRRRLR